MISKIKSLKIDSLYKIFPGYSGEAPKISNTRLDSWDMARDDRPVLEYLYQASQPKRHLEFGTWQGWGATLCLESCNATVWTLNLPDGELKADGSWAYGERVSTPESRPADVVAATFGEDEQGPRIYHQTDSAGYIGRLYREKGLGHRVCQIYCDSREWDMSNYPSDFFDSVLIDGGHQPEVVISDTRKTLQVLRSGGLIMWHDFCPVGDIRDKFESVKGVTAGIELLLPELTQQLQAMYWLDPSWILIGIKK